MKFGLIKKCPVPSIITKYLKTLYGSIMEV